MYNNFGVEKCYEDAIPVKRSRKAEKLRSEARREAASRNVGVDFVLNRKPVNRSIPRSKDEGATQKPERVVPKLSEKELEELRLLKEMRAAARKQAAEAKIPVKPVRPPEKPRVLMGYETPELRIIEPVTPPEEPVVSAPVTESAAEPAENVSVAENEVASAEVKEDALSKDKEGKEALTEYVNLSDIEKLVVSTDAAEVKDIDDKDTDAEAADADSDADADADKACTGIKVGELATISREKETVFAEKKVKSRGRIIAGRVIRRFVLSIFTVVMIVSIALMGALYTVANGPSESVRNTLVLSALQASATKWVPGVFLDDEVVNQILEDSQKVNEDVISIEDYAEQQKDENGENDKWANAIDGMIYEPVKGPTFKGYVLLIKDPSRVSVGVANDNFSGATVGMRIFEMADKYGAVAAINGGEYPDAGGMGTGGRPIGLTYSGGECKWSDGLRRSFMGFDKDNRLVVREGLTKAEADAMGIRDGVCFKTGKTLITNNNGQVRMYYADNDTGTAQRTAIGQTADGTVIFLVTDGRTASSLGATHNDVIDIMVSYGAISAGMLDGGSSSLMYYRDFYDKYGLDKSALDEYQKMGLINRYAAFTNPRKLPTCFIVAPE